MIRLSVIWLSGYDSNLRKSTNESADLCYDLTGIFLFFLAVSFSSLPLHSSTQAIWTKSVPGPSPSTSKSLNLWVREAHATVYSYEMPHVLVRVLYTALRQNSRWEQNVAHSFTEARLILKREKEQVGGRKRYRKRLDRFDNKSSFYEVRPLVLFYLDMGFQNFTYSPRIIEVDFNGLIISNCPGKELWIAFTISVLNLAQRQ